MVLKRMNEPEILKKAHLFAKNKHKEQLDDNGKDYYEAHLLPVFFSVAVLSHGDYELQAAALLHDTIEDTETTYEEIKCHFGKRVADLVLELTHEGKPDAYGYYFPRLKSTDAIMVKLIDRASNVSRMQKWSGQRQNHYLKRTQFWRDGSDSLRLSSDSGESN